VVSASNSKEALSLFEKDKFDVVITDLGMGRVSGFELAREVKRIDPAVPVILLTGWTVGEEDEEVRSSGIDSVLIKPCSLPTLCSAVQSTMRKPIAA
jgi:two-component system capsular synthesis sensor histidine kinase RcsC